MSTNIRLELASFPVKDVRFSRQTTYNNAILEINKEEIVALILEDRNIVSADLDVAFPNEKTRIVNVRDVVEPRIKVSGPGCVFPGILCTPRTVGEGRTHRLSGVTVMISAEYRPTLKSGLESQKTGIADMWGPAAADSPIGSSINIVAILKLTDSVTEIEAYTSIQLAELKVAQRLAETTKGMPHESIEIFELSEVDPSLPRVVCICSYPSHRESPPIGVAFYGMIIRDSLPTLLHPNELLDGAVTTDTRRGWSGRARTWDYMNHPLVLGLLREHGKRLNFLGVILQRSRFYSEAEKRVAAEATSQMARLLKADGALIVSETPSGNNFMDTTFTLQACERKGVKTVLLTIEWGETETADALPFNVPEANAIVSIGRYVREFKLEAPRKVIGVKKGQLVSTETLSTPFDPWGELTIMAFDMAMSVDYFGYTYRTCKEY